MGQQLWVTASLGGALTNNRLSKSLRFQADGEYKFKQFCNIKEAQGKGRGDTVFFDKVLQLDTKGGTLVETETVPEARWKVLKGTGTINEYGNSTPWTAKLETLAEFDPEDISSKQLLNDQIKVLDSAAAAEFAKGGFVAVCTNTATVLFTTNGTATGTADADISDKTHRAIVDYMKKKWIPPYAGSDYGAICSVNSYSGIYTYLQAIAMYTKPEYAFNGEVGRYYHCRIVEETSYLSDSKGSGSDQGEATYFGDEAVMEMIAEAPHITRDPASDGGRKQKAYWLALMGYKKIWDWSADDANSVGKGIERIVRVTSA